MVLIKHGVFAKCVKQGSDFAQLMLDDLVKSREFNYDGIVKSHSNDWIPAFAGMTDFLSI